MGHFTNYKIDHRSKKAMLNFIETHKAHSDSGWLMNETIAHNVRITHLNIPRDLVDAAFEYIDQDHWFMWASEFDFLKSTFELEHNNGDYQVFTAGRSGGWIELHARGTRSVFEKYDPWLSEESPIEDIRDLCEVIEDFDRFCDMVRDEFIACVQDFKDRKAEEAAEAEIEAEALLEPPFPL